MAWDNRGSVTSWGKRNTIRISRVKYTRLVGFQNPEPNFSVGKTEDKFVRVILRPSHTCHWCAHWKFVANGFFFIPLQSYFVDENDVITLSYSHFLGIRRKLYTSDKIAFLSFVRRLCGELVFLLPVFIKEIDWLNSIKRTLSAAPTANFLPEGAQAMAATFFMLSSKGITLPAYLSFIQNLNKRRDLKFRLKIENETL